MRLTDVILPAAVVPALVSQERDGVVAELVDALIAAGAAPASLRDEVFAKVMHREKIGSTAWGHGVAVPHAKHPGVTRVCAAIGLSPRGVEFHAFDRQPVYSVFLVLSPEDQPEQHLKAMEVIVANLSKDTFRRFLRQASSTGDVQTLLEESDTQRGWY